MKTESGTPPNQRGDSQNGDSARGNHPFFKNLLEQQIAQGLRQSPTEISLTMEPRLARHVVDALSKVVSQMLATGQAPVVLCAPQIRLAFRRFFESTFSDLAVLAYNEIPPRAEIQTTAVVPCPE